MSDEIEVKQEIEVVRKDLAKIPVEYRDGMVHLESLDAAYRFAKCVLASGMAPKTMTTEAAILVAMQYGAEVGLKPMQAIQNIAVINGRPGLFGKALPAVVQAKGVLESFEEWLEGKPLSDDWTAICKVVRKVHGQFTQGEIEKRTRIERFSWAQAKRAKLTEKPGPWQQYPDLMLRYRARGLAFNTLFADVLCGLGVVEELQDYPTRRPDIIEGNDALILEGK